MTVHARLIRNRVLQSSLRILDESHVFYNSHIIELCLQAARGVFVKRLTNLYVDEGTKQRRLPVDV